MRKGKVKQKEVDDSEYKPSDINDVGYLNSLKTKTKRSEHFNNESNSSKAGPPQTQTSKFLDMEWHHESIHRLDLGTRRDSSVRICQGCYLNRM
jgi:hypothetical protein